MKLFKIFKTLRSFWFLFDVFFFCYCCCSSSSYCSKCLLFMQRKA